MGDQPNAVSVPCPICGAPSLAQITGHLCEGCADTYVYCPVHADPDGPSRRAHVDGSGVTDG